MYKPIKKYSMISTHDQGVLAHTDHEHHESADWPTQWCKSDDVEALEQESDGFRQLLEEIKAIFERCDKRALGTCTLQGEPSFNVLDDLLDAINRELHKGGES